MIAREPVDFAHQARGALFDAALALVVFDMGLDGAGRGCGEAGLDLGAQSGLVALTASR